jgi:PBSX family phage portal protein
VPASTAKPFCFVTDRGESISADVLDQYAVKVAPDEHPAAGSRQLIDAFTSTYGAGALGIVQPLYNPEALAHVLELNTYHYRACKTKARDTAGLGWILRPDPKVGDAKPSEDQREKIQATIDDLSTSLTATLDQALTDYESIGWAAIEVIRDEHRHDGPVVDLVHMPAHTIRCHRDGKRLLQIRGSRRRWFVRAGAVDDDGERIDVNHRTGEITAGGTLGEDDRASEVLYWVNYTSRSDFYGLPDIIPALGAIHGDISRRNYNISFFDNFGVPAYAVYVTGDFDPGDPDEDGKTELQKSIEQHFTKLAKNPHSIMTLVIPTTGALDSKVEVKFEKLAVETREASFRLYRVDNRDEVLTAHGVPGYRVGVNETGSLGGSTAKESTEIYKRSVIDPRQQTVEDVINKHILTDGLEITDWQWRLVEIDTKDEAHDLDLLGKLWEMGAVTPQEIAQAFSERFSLSAATVEDGPLTWHYAQGTPIDAPPGEGPDAPGGIEAVLAGLRDEIIRAADRSPA